MNSVTPDGPVSSVILGNIRRANQQQPKTLHNLDLQISQSKLLHKLNALAENVSTSVWLNSEPTAASQADKKDNKVQFPNFFDVGEIIEPLAATCRIVTTKVEIENSFNATLEMCLNGSWTRVACYEFRHGQGHRYNYYSSGKVKPFAMDLPLPVVLEMAREDFHRNWPSYCHEFSKQNGMTRA